MGHLTSLVVRIILQGSLFDFDENWRVGPGGSIYYTNSNEVTGNQPWQWTIPRFTDDFPIKTSMARRSPCLVGGPNSSHSGSKVWPLRLPADMLGLGFFSSSYQGAKMSDAMKKYHGETRATYETINLTYVNKPWEFMEFGSLPQVFGMSCRERIMID